MIYSFDKKYNFFEIFNDKTGAMLRSNVIISGKESVAPTMRSFPELIDVGIMGHCHAANVTCVKILALIVIKVHILFGVTILTCMHFEGYWIKVKGVFFKLCWVELVIQ